MFEAYKWVIGKRKHETFTYMSARIERSKKAENARSTAAKCGSLVKTLFIYGTVVAFMSPVLWGLYQGFTSAAEERMQQKPEHIKKAEEWINEEKERADRFAEEEMQEQQNQFNEDNVEPEQEPEQEENTQEEPIEGTDQEKSDEL